MKRYRKGKRNPSWKGNNVGYNALHTWIRKRYPKPELCENCNERSANDLANISQKYRRDLSDWEYLCRKCHMIKDGRLKKFTLMAKQSIIHTDESKRKMSLSQKKWKRSRGKDSPFYGRKHTKQTIEKMRDSALKRYSTRRLHGNGQ